MSKYTSARMREESIFTARLGKHGTRVWTGLTTPEIRRERIREAIVQNGLAARRFSKPGEKIETFTQHFEQFFGEPLIPKLL